MSNRKITMSYPTVSNEMARELAKFVIKSYTNGSKFDKWNQFNLEDKSIGIYYGINQNLGTDLTDEELRNICNYPKASRNQILMFKNDIKKGDWIIIGQGKEKSLYLAKIDSDYYYQENESEPEEFYRHRRKITCIHKLPDDFVRKSSMYTVSKFN